jgi:pyruvyl transferase EpsI
MIEGIHEYIKIKYLDLKALAIAFLKPRELGLHSNKTAFVMLAAKYNNLGDIAITKAQIEYLKAVLPCDYEIVAIPVSETFNVFRSMKKHINSNTIITLIGGGNSGSLYDFVEWPRRFILKHFSECRIISFPQTVYYGSEVRAKVKRKEFVDLCKRCKQLTLVAREKQSFDTYQKMFLGTVECLLYPDIVFSMLCPKGHKRDGIAMVFRNDKEKQDHGDLAEDVKNFGEGHSISVTENDTCNVSIKGDGFPELENYINEIASKKLVVTDRLHGMIISFITGTPCIVFNNNNNKIGSTFDTWLREQGSVQLAEHISDEMIDRMLKVSLKGDDDWIRMAFDEFAMVVRRSV